jgi:hypothetical protein
MISDEPDEYADNLDDDSLLRTYLGAGSRSGGAGASGPEPDRLSVVPDWPPSAMQDPGLPVDAETLKWFETNHRDWRQGMCSVLRGWVEARTRGAASVRTEADPNPLNGDEGA